jgi:MFS family permease
VAGGLVADRMAKYGGLRRRIVGAAGLATLALPIGALGATTSADQVLILFGGWSFLSAAVATMQVTAIQDVVPNEVRGFAISLIAFSNIAVGLALGAVLPAILSDHLFHDPRSLAAALALVAAPASLSGCALLWFAASQARAFEPGGSTLAGDRLA